MDRRTEYGIAISIVINPAFGQVFLAEKLHCRYKCSTWAFFVRFLVRQIRLMMNKSTEETLTELCVILGKHDEVVPAFIYFSTRRPLARVSATDEEKPFCILKNLYGF